MAQAIISADQPGRHEIDRAEPDAAGKAFEPAMQVVPGHRPGDGIGNQHRNGELPKQQAYDIPRAGAEHLADADFLGTALCGERGQAVEPEAGDEDGNAHKHREHAAALLVRSEELGEFVAEEDPLDRGIGCEAMPLAIDGFERGRV